MSMCTLSSVRNESEWLYTSRVHVVSTWKDLWSEGNSAVLLLDMSAEKRNLGPPRSHLPGFSGQVSSENNTHLQYSGSALVAIRYSAFDRVLTLSRAALIWNYDKRMLLGHVPRCARAWLRPCSTFSTDYFIFESTWYVAFSLHLKSWNSVEFVQNKLS